MENTELEDLFTLPPVAEAEPEAFKEGLRDAAENTPRPNPYHHDQDAARFAAYALGWLTGIDLRP